MTKHERAISLIDISLDEIGMLLIHTKDIAKRKDIMITLEACLTKRNNLVSMEYSEINAYNEGTL